jgi:uracil-DNA glycosylase
MTFPLNNQLDIDISWLNELKSELYKPYMNNLRDYLIEEKSANKIIYPSTENILAALKLTPLNKTKVVILGQDPYHGSGQANGLAFSVTKDISIPPSLGNIFKEIKSDLNINAPNNGDLTFWANQGVLLLNSVLTVEKSSPASHANKGWEKFTDRIIEILNIEQDIVFLLWGNYAQKKGSIINHKRHKVLKAPHPSPLSAHRGFFGCRHFSKTNEYLQEKGKTKIKWIELS